MTGDDDDDDDHSCDVDWTGTNPDCIVRIGDFRSQTQGGWGSTCSGNNPGCYRDTHFDTAFPDGVTIGCDGGESLTFTSSAAVRDFPGEWWILLFPACTLLALALSVNLFGDWLRDKLNPRLK